MIYLVYIAAGYLFITTFILVLNRKDFGPLLTAGNRIFEDSAPQVSICIPARNEESGIEQCVRSALSQDYPNVEVLVLDDESTDRTPEILQKVKNEYPEQLNVLHGSPKPADWLGKPWACQQLGDHAEGRIIVFIDADTWLEKNMVSKIVRTMGHDVIDFLTIWPNQKLGSFWEKTVIPLVYYALLTMLPARYVYKLPGWIPNMLKPIISPLFAAACGQCLAFKKDAYHAIGGHESVKGEVVEDVELAKRIKQHGFKMKMYHGQASISCRMYSSEREIREGFSKNFLAGFNYNIPLFLAMALLHIVVFILPFILVPVGILLQNWLLVTASGICIVLIFVHRIILAAWFNWNAAYALLHPVGVLWFQKLGLELILKYAGGEKTLWKGRTIE